MILNLTQHAATTEQISAGVFEPAQDMKREICELLTFDFLPDWECLRDRAIALSQIAEESGADAAMIGGAPFFMAPLERALSSRGIKPLYAFTLRESVDEVLPDGTVRKTAVFRHRGFVEACR
jgi:hypothetical protein